jgi:hypothetical protein
LDINEIVNLGVSIAFNVFFVKYFFSDQKKLNENIKSLIQELKNMNSKIDNQGKQIDELRKVS